MKRKNPFKTPVGYFDNFAADFMAQLPETETAARMKPMTDKKTTPLLPRLRPLLYAACLIAVCFGGYLFWQNSESKHQDSKTAEYNKAHDQFVDDYLDCAMLDNGDIYACISE